MSAARGAALELQALRVLSRSNTTLVSRFDCPGGGQVWVEGTTMYVGHQRPTSGTSIVDVSDPAKPRLLARIDMPEGWHSHKVRVAGDIMIVNHENFGKTGPERIRRRACDLRCCRVRPIRN